MNIVNKSNLQKILTNYTDNESVQKSLNKLVTKLFNEHNINIPSDIFDKYFYMTYQLSQNKLSLLKDLSNAFQSGNYYRFCKVLAKIPNDVDTLVSADFTNKFKLFIIENRSKAKEFLQKYPTEQEYFLSQFNKDEINIIDFESSPIKFSRYLPKRLPDESIINYIERYKQLKKDSLLSKYNSIDYGEQFRDMTKWYPTIYSCSLLYNTEYHSFASGTFMCQLLNLIVNFGDRVSKLPILGITESILNILDNSLYVLDKDNFNLDILEAQYITLFGTYFTSISNKIENLNNRYAYQFLSTSKSLNEKLKYFNFRDELEALVMSDETSFVIEDGGDNDYEAAMDELRIFTNGYDEFAEILR